MTTLPLTLRYSETPARPTAAWFLPGDDPSRWLGGMLDWGIPTEKLSVRLIPMSAADRRPLGALVVAPSDTALLVSSRARGYGVLAGRLYIPVEARLCPAVTEEELDAWLPSAENVYVWHPSAGLVGFEPSEALTVEHLLDAPRRCPTAWDRAAPGVAHSRRLVSVEPEEPPTSDSILGRGREEIESDSEGLEELPPLPDESRPNPARRAADRARQAMASGIQRLFGAASSARGGSWSERLRNWASRTLSRPLLEQRQRELNRLMRLLDTDPDEGLRFAIPFGGGRTPGAATPSGRLGERRVDFSLSHLEGGGPADAWDVDDETRRRLHERYRELANRELRMGRHRRAAYIFAELLADLHSAASALVAGRHYREAAVLYRDRLRDPGQAARCLEGGGLWEEAAQLYEDVGAFEQAGELYRRMDRPEDAERLFRAAVDKARAQGDYLRSAKLLHEKLEAPDEALGALDAAWPHSPQALPCLNESFRLLGSLERHDAARAKVERLLREPRSQPTTLLLVDSFATTATSYPSGELRDAAADAARVVAAPQLRSAPAESARRLLAHLARLVPHDRLHARDCDRFLRDRREQPPPPAPRRGHAFAPPPRLVRRIRLESGVDWRAAASGADEFYVAGVARGYRLVVARGNWDADAPSYNSVQWQRLVGHGTPILAADPDGQHPVLVHGRGAPYPEQSFPLQSDARRPVTVQSPPWAGAPVLGLTWGPGGIAWAVSCEQGKLILSGYHAEGGLFVSHVVPFEPGWAEAPVSPSLPMFAGPRGIFFAWGNQVIGFTGQQFAMREMNGPVYGITGARSFQQVCVAVALGRGAAVIRDRLSGRFETCADGLPRPCVGITASGHLVVASSSGTEIYNLGGSSLRIQSRSAEPLDDPLAVLATAHARRYGLCLRNGEVLLFEIP